MPSSSDRLFRSAETRTAGFQPLSSSRQGYPGSDRSVAARRSEELPRSASRARSDRLLRPHVLAVDPGDGDRLLHRVAAEGLAELLVEDDLDEGRLAILLRGA